MTVSMPFRFACLCLLGLISTASVALPPSPIGENLVHNPSFEQATPDSILPAGWTGSKAAYSRATRSGRNDSAALKYVNQDPKQYRLCTQKVPCKPGKKYRYSVWVKTEDIRGEESGATVCMEWQGPDGKWLGGSYVGGIKGTQDWARREGFARIPKEATAVNLSCYVRRGMVGTAWFDDVELVQVTDPPLETMLLEPLYRGRITAAGPKQVRLCAHLRLDDLELQSAQVRLEAALCDAAGAERSRQQLTPESSQAEMTFPAADLPPGKYVLRVRLVGPEVRLLHETQHELTRMADDFQARCWIDEHRRLIVDQKPFFPLGLYFGGVNEKDLTLYAQSKFNCLMAYGSPKPEQMDLIQRLGLKVIYSIKDFYFGMKYTPKSLTSVEAEEPMVRQRVRQFRDHPALLAWYLNDELPQTFMPQLNAHQRWVAEEDPNHPTWVVLYQYKQVFDYRNSFDVIGTDPYPIGRKPASEAAQWTAEVARQLRGSRPIWQVPQLHNWANYHKEAPAGKFRSPTIAEIRSMAWQCIAEGATGLVFYCWNDLKRNPDAPFDSQWEGLKDVAAQIDRAAPILLSINPLPAGVTIPQQPAWLHWLARSHGGRVYLFLVNDGDGSGAVEITVPRSLRTARELSSGTSSTLADRLVVPLQPLEVRSYELSP